MAVRDGRTWRAASGRAMLTVDGHLLGVHSGDVLQVYAEVRRITSPGNPGEMDYAAHARADSRRTSLRASNPDCVTVLQRGSSWTLRRVLDALRRTSQRRLRDHLNFEQTPLAAALLLGSREQLDENRTAAFFRTNTIHFLAISGLHVGILASSLFFALRWGLMPRGATLWAVALATVAYTLLTGAPPSAIRAMILVILVCASLHGNRPVLPFNCLAAAALVILALNPDDLFRTGPQLSFLAVSALAWFRPLWTRWRSDDPLDQLIARSRSTPLRAASWLGRWILRAMMVSATVWIVTLPLIMARFHLVAPVAIVLSVVLTPVVAAALLSGFGVLTLGQIARMVDGALERGMDALVVVGRLPMGSSYPWGMIDSSRKTIVNILVFICQSSAVL